VLYNFADTSDDTGPGFDLIADSAGNLYGTTEYTTVFQLVRPSTPGGTWTKNVLHRFTGPPDGFAPSGGLIMDAAGNLYGQTWQGGDCSLAGDGTVFELSPPATSGGEWTEQILHKFTQSCGGYGGFNPTGDLVMGKGGALFGVTANGGTGTLQPGGTVFLLTPPHTGHPDWTKTILHNFDPFVRLDGLRPEGGLAIDPKGNLYGTTTQGGVTPSPCANYGGCGIVFELSPPATLGGAWTETILHAFVGGEDGDGPKSGLLLDAKGNLYGEAPFGGASVTCGPYGPCGAVFELAAPTTSGGSWSFSTLHTFTGIDKNGVFPVGGLTFGAYHRLFGVTGFASNAQPNARGTVSS